MKKFKSLIEGMELIRLTYSIEFSYKNISLKPKPYIINPT